MHLLESSDGWEEDTWEDVCTLPKGVKLVDNVPDDVESYLRKYFNAKYECGKAKYRVDFMCGWRVMKICPCGNGVCDKHVIPSEAELLGDMEYDGKDLGAEFMRKPVCTKAEAIAYFSKYPGTVEVKGNRITRRIPWEWNKICKFPKGHEMYGYVHEGEEMNLLKQRFETTFPEREKKI